MRAKLVAALLTAVAMLIAAPMWASLYDFTVCSNIATIPPGPSSCPTSAPWDSGQASLTYSDGIVATGYLGGPDAPGGSTRTDISIKVDGTNEHGLGIVKDANRHSQISSSSTLVLNLSALSFTSGTLTLESEQSTDDAEICFSSSGTLGSFVADCFTQTSTGPATVAQAISWAGNPFVAISGFGTEDVLVDSLASPTVTPEPGTLMLFGSGLLGLGSFLRRRFKA